MPTSKWKSGNDGIWDTAGNWSTDTVPGSSDDAVIDASGSYTVTLSVPIPVGSIAVSDSSATLAVNDPGQTETVGGGLTNGGDLLVDTGGGQGGTTLSIGGTLSNSNSVAIGNGGLSAATTVTAAGLSNTGTITIRGSASNQATLDIAAPAGFGTAGVLSGQINMSGDALLEFTSGQITTIASTNSSYLQLDGAKPLVADASDTSSNSALTGLSSIAGRLFLDNGASIAPSGNLSVTGELHVDDGGNEGGTTLPITGTLSNSNSVAIGNGGLSAATTVTAAGLSNTGTITIRGSASNQATLDIAAPAGFGTAGVLSGQINMSGDALLEFTSGQITTIASTNSSYLQLDGAKPLVADASDTSSNSALTGLSSIAGRLFLDNGASIAPSGNLSVTGELHVDDGGNEGGTTLPITGTLSNSNSVAIGNGGLSAATTVTAAGLSNTGTINLTGHSGAAAELIVNGAASTSGTISIGSNAELDVTGGNAYTQTGGTTTVSGTLAAASINVTGGLLDFTVALSAGSGTGDINIGGTGSVEFGAAVDAGHKVTFTSAVGTLDLAAPNQFAPTVYGFADGDTIDFLHTAVTAEV
jgi:hypothetical protein